MFEHLSYEWQNCIEQFLQQVFNRSGSVKSQKLYTYTLKTFFATFPDKTPADITKADCAMFVALPSKGRRNYGQPVSVGTRNSRIQVLNSVFKYLSEQDITLPDGTERPLYDKPLPTRSLHYAQPSKPYRSMDQREVATFFNAIDQSTIRGKRDYALMLFAFLTLRRRGELVRLKWGDVSETVFFENGVERRGFSYRYTGKGSQRAVKQAELPMSCYHALIAYLEASGRLKDINASDYLFTNVRHSCGHVHYNEPICSDWLNHIAKDIMRKANLPVERLSVHSLRHAGARARFEAGSTLFEVQRALNHASPEITLRYLATQLPQSDTGARLLESRLSFLCERAK